MKTLITGGLGLVGRPVVEHLVRKGHEVHVIDRPAAPNPPLAGAAYTQADVTDFAAVREAVRGMDAIVHLAAIPIPFGAPQQDIFRINCSGTFNVYEAAAQEGIRRIATASSINWLGYYYGPRDFPIRYFPIDEEHPGSASDVYSFSKQVTEDIAAYYWRREGITSTCLRLPGVYVAGEGWHQRMKERLPRMQAMYQEWIDLPAAERAGRLQQKRDIFARLRQQRFLEISNEERTRLGLDLGNPDVQLYSSICNFWVNIDARDAAQAFEKSLAAEFEGSHPLFVNGGRNITGIESESLLQVFFPEVSARTHPLVGAEAPVSIEQARKLIGFEPEYSIEKFT